MVALEIKLNTSKLPKSLVYNKKLVKCIGKRNFESGLLKYNMFFMKRIIIYTDYNSFRWLLNNGTFLYPLTRR